MKKILIVDDHPDIRTIIKLALRNRFALEEADNAVDALEIIESAPPSAVILDVMMPGELDGFGLCRHIKSDPRLTDIHIILLTARAQIADQERGYALGANAYFIKPFSPLALALHLDSVLTTGQSSSTSASPATPTP
jgi:CheY-like chemotaxis protein